MTFAKISSVKDNIKFLLGVFITLLLMILVASSVPKKSVYARLAPRVDIKKIEKLVRENKLSLHPAQFYKKLASPEEAQ